MTVSSLGWWGIVRLGMVQSAIGATAVLMTVIFNRVMVVEMALPASLPAALVAWHYGLQLSRPRWGHGSDRGQNRTKWIICGICMLALGAVLAANATILLPTHILVGLSLGIIAYAMIGAGIAASGTSLLALLATSVTPARRPAAAAIAWSMMILGIVLTAAIGGKLLDPYSPQRLVLVASGIALIAVVVTLLAIRGVEASHAAATPTAAVKAAPDSSFLAALRQLWHEKLARDFTIFVFVSMLAYSTQELILEPYAGLVFGYSLGRSTQLAGFQHGGVLLGMILIGALGSLLRSEKTNLMGFGVRVGCAASALALAGLAAAGFMPELWPLAPTVFVLGLANGIFAVSALGLMMSFAGAGRPAREGVRMGVWGAAQAAAFGIGGCVGASALDLMRHLLSHLPSAFASVFALQAACFLAAAVIALRLGRAPGHDKSNLPNRSLSLGRTA